MAAVVLVDTGPFVALFDPADRARPSVRSALGGLASADLVTTEAVLTEASFLLDFSIEAQVALHAFVTARVRVLEIERGERGRVAALMKKYRSLPMDYADATLVVVAERLGVRRVLTLDRRDFSVYRLGRRAFEILPRR